MMRQGAKQAALVVAVIATSMTFIDATALNQALPTLADALQAGGSELLWVVGTYNAALALLLLPAGRLADRIGHRQTLAVGIYLFAIASIACAAAPQAIWLIVARAVQGSGAAIMVTGSLAVLTRSYPSAARGRAIGSWSAWCALATIAGPLIGGSLAAAGMWRMIFLVNVPLAGIALVCLRSVKLEAASDRGGRQTSLWRLQAVRAVVGSSLLLYTALYGLLLVLPLALIAGAGYRADYAAAAQLALVLMLIAVCPLAGGWVDRRGPRVPVSLGCAIAALACAWLATSGFGERPGDYFARLLLPLSLVGGGTGLAIVGLSTTMMNAVDERAVGAAAALNALVARGAALFAVLLFGGFLIRGGVNLTSLSPQLDSWPGTFRTSMGFAVVLCAGASLVAAVALRSCKRAASSPPQPAGASPALEPQSLPEKGADPLRRGQKHNENDSLPEGQTPFRIGSPWAGERP